MKKIIFIQILLLLTIDIFAFNSGVNFTIIPGVNLIPNQEETYLSTGFISSEVNKLNGLSAGPIYSISRNKVDGLQAGGIFNIAGGDVDGLQAAGVFNTAHNINGLQAGGVFNISKDVDGLQASGAFNIAGDVDGLQGSGVFNIADRFDGIQGAGVLNIADDFSGLQVSGLLNISNEMDGVQVSVFNIASKGNNLQIGVINIVTEDSRNTVPIGILNIYADGIFDISAWMDKRGYIYQGLETGNKHFYTQFYTGTKEEAFKELDGRIFGTGLGLRTNFLFLDLDITAGGKFIYDTDSFKDFHSNKTSETKNIWTPEIKASLGLDLGLLTLFGGIDGDFKIDDYNDESDFFVGNKYIELSETVDLHYTLFAGVKLGLN